MHPGRYPGDAAATPCAAEGVNSVPNCCKLVAWFI